jgi:integration host factor subunit beta
VQVRLAAFGQKEESINMIKSELITSIAGKQAHLTNKDIELAVNTVIDYLSQSLARGTRIEIRGFGGFSLRKRDSRIGRNPKTGQAVKVPGGHALHFKPGLALRERVNQSRQKYPTIKDN